MAHLQPLFFFLFLFLLLPILPTQGFLLQLTKDQQTHQYTTHLLIGTPLLPTKLLFHLSGPSLWLTCPPSSPSRYPITSGSLQCSMAGHKSCHVLQHNPITGESNFGDLAEDIVSIDEIKISTVDKFLLSCSPDYLVNGLVNGAKGVLGFGRSKISFHSQMVNKFANQKSFSMCLSSSNGFLVSERRFSLSKHLTYTPLGMDDGYYVNVNGIKINGRRLAIGRPIGRVEISTAVPYSVMESSIYMEFVKAFVTAGKGMNMTVVGSPLTPFGVCFSYQVSVPTIELVLQSELVKWRLNSMVEVGDSVMCLGFVDGGFGMNSSVVLGGYQLEEHLLEFDLGTGMMGFGSTVLMEGGSCSNIGASLRGSL